MNEEMFWKEIRRALLVVVDAIEKRYGMPLTSQLRKQARDLTNVSLSQGLDKPSETVYYKGG